MPGTQQQPPRVAPKGGGGAPPKPVAAKPPPQPVEKTAGWSVVSRFLNDDFSVDMVKQDESAYHVRHENLVRLIWRQSMVIFFLLFIVIMGSILLHPIYTYYVKPATPDGKPVELVSLTEPNLTDQAILSWVANSITEILTFGFGDIGQRIGSQSHRFTSDGWDSFVAVLRKQNLLEEFKSRQLVLTTVPSNSPVIVSKGVDKDGDYTWVVEMPVIRTYSTNNGVTSGKKGIIRLTLARIPSLTNKAGIGIKMWKEM